MFMDEENLIPLIVGSIVLALVLIVILIIICAVCIKRKHRDQKAKHLIAGNVGRDAITPAYREMAFTSNMEGTADSIAQYKRNPTIVTSSPMMPLPASYSVRTKYRISFKTPINTS